MIFIAKLTDRFTFLLPGEAVDHPHLHCIVPGGGLSLDGSRWVACKPGFSYPCGCCRACSGGSSWNNSALPTTYNSCSFSDATNFRGTLVRSRPKPVIQLLRSLGKGRTN